jgi:transportin-1
LQETDTNQMIASIITLVVRYGQVHNWTPILTLLIENLKHTDLFVVKLSLDTLVLICRDVAHELDITSLLPQLVQLYSHADVHVRFQALHATSQFILIQSSSFADQLNLILNTMYDVTMHDKETCIRQELSRILTSLFEAYPRQMYLERTLEYMIQALNDDDDDIKMSACTFWSQYADSQLYRPEHAKHLPRLMGCLLDLMTYSETELSDLQCVYHRAVQPPLIVVDKKQAYTPTQGSDLDEDEDSDVSDVVDEEFYSDDSLRKRSAQTLEALSTALGAYTTPTILEQLVNRLVHPDWLVRESGILALGAAAEGLQKKKK